MVNHIISPNNRDKRLAPIGATVTVTAPTPKPINVACNLTLDAGADYTTVVNDIKKNLDAYFKSGIEEIKRNKVGSIIMATDGVSDYGTLTLNGGTANITVSQDEYPELGTFTTDAEV